MTAEYPFKMQNIVEITMAKKNIGSGRCFNTLNRYEVRTEGHKKRDVQVSAEEESPSSHEFNTGNLYSKINIENYF